MKSSEFTMVNKSTVTNILALLTILSGCIFNLPILSTVGLFALSGAITNWLAIHMLFEKVPGLYGSGVIPARFEAFKQSISELMMQQFFNQENIDRFVSETAVSPKLDVEPLLAKIDFEPTFDALVETVEQSSLGGMLAMFGGTEVLIPLKQPFIQKMQESIITMSHSDTFHEQLQASLVESEASGDIRIQIQQIVEQRLSELTPQLVKEMVQHLIKAHLGWLVVWGGVFGGLIGLISSLLPHWF